MQIRTPGRSGSDRQDSRRPAYFKPSAVSAILPIVPEEYGSDPAERMEASASHGGGGP